MAQIAKAFKKDMANFNTQQGITKDNIDAMGDVVAVWQGIKIRTPVFAGGIIWHYDGINNDLGTVLYRRGATYKIGPKQKSVNITQRQGD